MTEINIPISIASIQTRIEVEFKMGLDIFGIIVFRFVASARGEKRDCKLQRGSHKLRHE